MFCLCRTHRLYVFICADTTVVGTLELARSPEEILTPRQRIPVKARRHSALGRRHTASTPPAAASSDTLVQYCRCGITAALAAPASSSSPVHLDGDTTVAPVQHHQMCPECTVVVLGITVTPCAPASSSSSPSSCASCTAVHRLRHHGRPSAAVPAERPKHARHHGRPLLSRTSMPQRQQHPEICLIGIIGVRCNDLRQQHHAAVAPTTTTPQRLQ
uniref:Uncharacterized protein n=1 Tax=Anopheles merus TaxID=30066 RepID=A0A182UYD1_ANOME